MLNSGEQIVLAAGDYETVVATVGATLRSLRFQGRDLVVPFEARETRPSYRGAVLVPWPNRVVDGRYRFDGIDYQLALNEPERGHALHGLALWHDFAVVDANDTGVTLRTRVCAEPGYPTTLDVEVTYALNAEGLSVTVESENVGASTAPYGSSIHPYLVAGAGRVDDWTVSVDVEQVLEVTPDRLIPTRLEPVGERRAVLSGERPIGDTFFDHAFTGIPFDAAGMAALTLRDDDGDGVRMQWARGLDWLQLHTADRPGTTSHRSGLAVEPMTCPPDAFNSGTDLLVLEPGERHAARFYLAGISG